MKTDAQIIDGLGGAAKVAEMLGFDPEIGTQRVHNWKSRGIPAAVKLKHLDIFGHAPQCDCPQPTEDEKADIAREIDQAEAALETLRSTIVRSPTFIGKSAA